MTISAGQNTVHKETKEFSSDKKTYQKILKNMPSQNNDYIRCNRTTAAFTKSNEKCLKNLPIERSYKRKYFRKYSNTRDENMKPTRRPAYASLMKRGRAVRIRGS